jgi:large repetitive protein
MSVVTATNKGVPQRIAFAYRQSAFADNQSLYVVTSGLRGGAVGTSYSATISTVGGTSPYTYSLIYGSLPSGLTLNAGSGVISGTPTIAGSSTFTVRSTDAHGLHADQSFTLTVSSAAATGGGVTGWMG